MNVTGFIKEQNQKLIKKFRSYFNHKEMHELFLKYGNDKLGEEELLKINKWANAYEDRAEMFENLKKTLDFENQISNAKGAEIKVVLTNLKVTFPTYFADIPSSTPSIILMKVLPASIKQLNYEYAYGIVYGNRVIRIIAFLVWFAIVVLILLIALKLFFKI